MHCLHQIDWTAGSKVMYLSIFHGQEWEFIGQWGSSSRRWPIMFGQATPIQHGGD